jgi:hypothetical protein
MYLEPGWQLNAEHLRDVQTVAEALFTDLAANCCSTSRWVGSG